MTKRYLLIAVAVVCVVLVWSRPAETQAPTLVYGSASGTLKPIALDSSGNLAIPTTDPCASPGVAKLSAVLAVTADAVVVTGTASQVIYVCGFAGSISGTNPTLRFWSGTGAVCATSQDNLTGVIVPTAGIWINYGGSAQTVFNANSGEDLCADVGGTPSVQGVLTYVKQ